MRSPEFAGPTVSTAIRWPVGCAYHRGRVAAPAIPHLPFAHLKTRHHVHRLSAAVRIFDAPSCTRVRMSFFEGVQYIFISRDGSETRRGIVHLHIIKIMASHLRPDHLIWEVALPMIRSAHALRVPQNVLEPTNAARPARTVHGGCTYTRWNTANGIGDMMGCEAPRCMRTHALGINMIVSSLSCAAASPQRTQRDRHGCAAR